MASNDPVSMRTHRPISLRERRILELRAQRLSLRTIANELGVSKDRVRQIYSDACRHWQCENNRCAHILDTPVPAMVDWVDTVVRA